MSRGGWPLSRRKKRKRKLLLFIVILIAAAALSIKPGKENDTAPDVDPGPGIFPAEDTEQVIYPEAPENEEQDAAEMPDEPEEQPPAKTMTADYYQSRAQTRAAGGDYSSAMDDYARAMKIDPGLSSEILPEIARLHYEMGFNRIQRGEYDKAEFDYARAMELDPGTENALFYFNRGILHTHKAETDRAISLYTKAILADPEFPGAYLNRGASYRSKGLIERAVSDYSRAIELNPGYALAYLNRGEAYGTLGDYKNALSDFKKYLELDPQSARAAEIRSLAVRLADRTGD